MIDNVVQPLAEDRKILLTFISISLKAIIIKK